MTSTKKVTMRYGPFNIISSDKVVSKSINLYGEWAQLEIVTLTKFVNEGDTVVDVGAYLGSHTLAFSEHVGDGKVIAFEARKNIFDLLEENTKARDNIQLIHSALGKAHEYMNVELHSLSEGQNFGGLCLESTSESDDIETIVINALDTYNFPQVDFLKIDVEGMEHDVLLGAEITISKFSPHIFLEINSVEQAKYILDWANEHNYRIFGIITSAFNCNNFNNVEENMFNGASETGFLLIFNNRMNDFIEVIEAESCVCEIDNLDDVVLLMLSKRQYPYEVLSKSVASRKLTLGYFSPIQLKLEEEIQVMNLDLSLLDKKISELERESQKAQVEINEYKVSLGEHESVTFLVKKLFNMIFKRG